MGSATNVGDAFNFYCGACCMLCDLLWLWPWIHGVVDNIHVILNQPTTVPSTGTMYRMNLIIDAAHHGVILLTWSPWTWFRSEEPAMQNYNVCRDCGYQNTILGMQWGDGGKFWVVLIAPEGPHFGLFCTLNSGNDWNIWIFSRHTDNVDTRQHILSSVKRMTDYYGA